MAIKNIIAAGIGFAPGSVKYIVTHGFTVGVPSEPLDGELLAFITNSGRALAVITNCEAGLADITNSGKGDAEIKRGELSDLWEFTTDFTIEFRS